MVLTFDDGLNCHYDYVYQELKQRNLWGIFYVPTYPYLNQKLLSVHRIHVLLASCDANEVLSVLKSKLTPELLVDGTRQEFRERTYRKQDNVEAENEVKKTLNYYIDYRFVEQILDELIAHFGLFDLCQSEKFYITPQQIREMQEGGMIIGSHTVNHPVMSKLSRSAQAKELSDSFDFLGGLTLLEPKTFCYPYGGSHSYTSDTIELLEQLGCLFSFDVNSRDISMEDIQRGRQVLPRYDCNEFPYGQVRDLSAFY